MNVLTIRTLFLSRTTVSIITLKKISKSSFITLNIQFVLRYFKGEGSAHSPNRKAHAQSVFKPPSFKGPRTRCKAIPEQRSEPTGGVERLEPVSLVLLPTPFVHVSIHGQTTDCLRAGPPEPVAWVWILPLTLTSFVTCILGTSVSLYKKWEW